MYERWGSNLEPWLRGEGWSTPARTPERTERFGADDYEIDNFIADLPDEIVTEMLFDAAESMGLASLVVDIANETAAELAVQAGIPKGVFNIVTGSAGGIGGELCANPIVRKLTFTGSTEVGRILLKQAADQVMKCSMELGGNAPFIVFDDADLDTAVEGAMICKFRNNGQTCVCANRIYVQAGVYDAFAEKLTAAVKNLNVGDGLTPGGIVTRVVGSHIRVGT